MLNCLHRGRYHFIHNEVNSRHLQLDTWSPFPWSLAPFCHLGVLDGDYFNCCAFRSKTKYHPYHIQNKNKVLLHWASQYNLSYVFVFCLVEKSLLSLMKKLFLLLRLHCISAKISHLWQSYKIVNHQVRGLPAAHQTNEKCKAAPAISQGKRGYITDNSFSASSLT